MKKKRKSSGVEWVDAPDIKKRVVKFKKSLNLDWLELNNLHCFRSYNSKSKAYARIWGLTKVWQKALNQKPSYVIEVLSEKFDKLSKSRQDEVILHEIAHIPKNYSGSLLPHIKSRGKRNFNDRVRQLIRKHRSN
jgi:predicted metallopeptidase